MTRFQHAVAYLEGFINYEQKSHVPYSGREYDLASFAQFLAHLGNPHLASAAFHIAGTKGKGSTAALVSSALAALGLRVGLYTSPHLLSVRERIRVDNRAISETQFAELIEQIRPVADQDGRSEIKHFRTFFELVTAAAMVCFQRERLDAAVYETGMGGRLDSTNVVNAVVAGICPIDYDHIHALGSTIQQIATEKAGIIKPRQTVVSAEQSPEALEVIHNRCQDQQARLLLVGQDITYRITRQTLTGSDVELTYRDWDPLPVSIPLAGAHQAHNLAVAYGMLAAYSEQTGLTLKPEAVKVGFGGVTWPGRFQLIDQNYFKAFVDKPDLTLILDCAHNPASARALVATLKTLCSNRPLTFVVGSSKDKDYQTFIASISAIATNLVFSRFTNPRAADPVELQLLADPAIPSRVVKNPGEALLAALCLTPPTGVVIVTGSIFLVSDVLHFLNVRLE